METAIVTPIFLDEEEDPALVTPISRKAKNRFANLMGTTGNVSSSNTWATGCSLHHIMVAITSG